MANASIAETDLAIKTYGSIVGNRWVQLAAGVGSSINSASAI